MEFSCSASLIYWVTSAENSTQILSVRYLPGEDADRAKVSSSADSDLDAAHLAQLIVMTEARWSKYDTSTAQQGKECSESYRRLGPDPCDDVAESCSTPTHWDR